jgi:hypothetical protein
VPPPEPNARQELAVCSGSTTVEYTSSTNTGKLGDVANIMCRLDVSVSMSTNAYQHITQFQVEEWGYLHEVRAIGRQEFRGGTP